MMRFFILLFTLPVIIFSCSSDDDFAEAPVSVDHPDYKVGDSCMGTAFEMLDFEIIELPLIERPYVTSLETMVFPTRVDDNKVLLHEYNGKPDYHPVAMSAYGLSLLDLYRQEKQDSCLVLAKRHADKLLGISIEIDSVRLFPYSFNYKFFEKDQMVAPWFSGMAQGMALSLFSRLYEMTGEAKYKEVATQIYRSFKRLKSTDEVWISCVDKSKNLWFEEYPFEAPSHVFNGMNFAIFGVYDYYMINKTEDVSELLRGAMSTVKNNMHLIRKEKDISYYGLKYNVQNPHYHPIHIDQLAMLSKMSGMKEFQLMSDKLKEDHSEK